MRRTGRALGWLIVLPLSGCGGPSRQAPPAQAAPVATKPKPPAVTRSTFEPVYRAAKAIQGATAPGVTYAKFGELLQSLSTEISIAADQNLNETDKKLLDLYRLAFNHYRVSDQLWKLKLNANDKMWRGEIPYDFGKDGAPDPVVLTAIELYKLPVYQRSVANIGKKYKSVPGDSVQRAWAAADVTLKQATDMYYGRGAE